jgi:hypothetical protein
MFNRSLRLTLFAISCCVTSLCGQSTPLPVATPTPRTPSNSAIHRVSVGVYLTALYDTDPSTSSFLADFYIWTNQQPGNFDPLDALVFPGSRRQDTLFQSRRVVDGVEWSLRRFRGAFYHDWDLKDFPFDKHLIKIQFRDGAHESRVVDFVPDLANSAFNQQITLPGWRMSDFTMRAENITYNTTFGNPGDDQPQTFTWITASVVMQREAFLLFVKLLIGGYLSLGAAMFACLMVTTQPPVFAGRMVLQISSLFSAIINNRATDSVMGRNDQFTLPDLLHILIYMMIFCALVITLRSRWLCEKGMEVQAKFMERRATVILVTLFAIANVILIWRATLSPVQFIH